MTFPDYDELTNPLFIRLGIVNFNYLIFYHNVLFVLEYLTGSLPDTFPNFFIPISKKNIIISGSCLKVHTSDHE